MKVALALMLSSLLCVGVVVGPVLLDTARTLSEVGDQLRTVQAA